MEKHIGLYHDSHLLDYLKFGFPLGLHNRKGIRSTFVMPLVTIIQPQLMQTRLISSLIKNCKEESYLDRLMRNHILNLLGPPLMTRPKGDGRHVILDLSYGENSVNNATDRDHFDGDDFTLTLPSLANLLPALRELGSDVRLYKIDISRAFRNVPVVPGDSTHLGIKWKDKYYVEKFLAFGAVHGTGIFQKITDFVRFILAQEGIIVYNYIDIILLVVTRIILILYFKNQRRLLQTLASLSIRKRSFHPL